MNEVKKKALGIGMMILPVSVGASYYFGWEGFLCVMGVVLLCTGFDLVTH